MTETPAPLISYIAPAAPATRRPAEGDEPFLRPEIGFTPKWYREALGIDFGERWHTDPAYRAETVQAMRDEFRRRFPGTRIGGIHRPDHPADLITGAFGGCIIAAIYGAPLVYAPDNWPSAAQAYLSDDEIDRLEPPDLDHSAFFGGFMRQVEWIAAHEGRAEGYLNPQGVLNNAYRLRGEALFVDMLEAPDRARRLFACVCETMIDATRRLRARQRRSGVSVDFFTVSNCLVNLVSPSQYRDLLLPLDVRLAQTFSAIGIHNCAWKADPYLELYATVPGVAYIDMGLASDLRRARQLFPKARRALMYTPMDLAGKSMDALRRDFERIAADYGPCDLILADIEHDTPDERVRAAIALCEEITRRYE